MNKSDSADAGKTRSHRVKLVSISRDDEIPASSFQERMYFLFELNPKNTGSNGLLLYDVTGFVDQRLIKESLLSLIKRYEVFRTQFKRVKDKIVQIITPASEASVVFSFSDLSQLTSTQQNTSLKEATAKLDYKPFDLGKGPLCRFQLFKLTDDHFVLAQVHHHIITDHFTNNIFIQELSRVYSALKTGSPLNLPNIDFQYADFAAWEKANVTEEFIGPQIKYWKENLTNAPNLLHLPLDRPRPSKTGSNFRTESIIIPNESWNQLKIIGFKERATPAILGMAVFSILLHRFSGDNDICIGAPIEMRARRGLFSLMGPMIDNFVIRSKYNKKIIFPEYLANFVASSLNAYANCDVSIDKVISLAGSVRSMSYAPLYQTMFQFFSKNQDEVAPATKDLIFTNRGGGHVGAQDMDIVCQLEESRNEVNLKFAYNADLFVRETILQMLSSFNNLTEEIVKKPLEEIGNLTLLSPVLKRKSILERPDKIQNIKNAEEIELLKYAPPINDIEKNLAKVWEEVLQTEPIGREANYFSLGGNSLSLIKSFHLLQEQNYGIELADLYNCQTIAELAALICKRKAQGENEDRSLPGIKTIIRNPKDKKFSLSYVQETLFNALKKGSLNYFISSINELSGPLDVDAFRKSLDLVMERQWSLKTKFSVEGEVNFQVIHSPEVPYFFQKDLRHIPQEQAEDALINQIQEDLKSEFDLSVSPMFKCFLNRIHDEQYYFVILVQHIVFDGISLILFRREIEEFYASQIENRLAVVPEIFAQYIDFAHWERETFSNAKLVEKRMMYWKEILTDLPEQKFPFDFPRTHNENTEDITAQRVIETSAMQRLMDLSKRENVTLYVLLLTALNKLLQEITGQNEIVVIETISQRPLEMENVMGYFTSFLPLRVSLSQCSSTTELLHHVRERSVGSQVNLIPTAKISEVAISAKDRQRLGEVSVLVNFIADYREPLCLTGIKSSWVEMDPGGGNAGDFYVQFSASKDHINFFFSGNQNLFRIETVEKFADRFQEILSEMAKN